LPCLTKQDTGARIVVDAWILPPVTAECKMDDPYDLQRFVDAQEPVYAQGV
jgi:hypothetical protein